MKLLQSIFFSGALVMLSSVALAVEETDGNMVSQVECCSGLSGASIKTTLGKMDIQLKVMREIHEKILIAKNDKVRKGLLPEHLRVMKESLVLMNNLPAMDDSKMMDAMKMMENKKPMFDANKMAPIKNMETMKGMKTSGPDMENMKADKNDMPMRVNMMGDMMKEMNNCRMMMEKRMEMITLMLEMTLDRMPNSFSK